MPKNTITRLERWKIYIEIFGILVVSFGGGWSVFQHFDQLKKDKSDKLYSDLIIEGTIKYIEDLGKILDYQIGPATKESYNRENKLYNVLTLIEDSDNLNKLKNKEIKVEIDPLTDGESQELGKRYAKVDDIMNMKMFFLGDEICEAIRASARLISEERPHYQSNIILRERKKELKKKKEISLFDAYRYWIFVERNYNFLKNALITISEYILEQNYTSFRDYKGVQKLAKLEANKNSNDVRIAIHNLIELKERYYRYEDCEKPEYSISDKGKKLCVIQLIQFFEEYNRKRKAKEKPFVAPISESRICTVFVKKEKLP